MRIAPAVAAGLEQPSVAVLVTAVVAAAIAAVREVAAGAAREGNVRVSHARVHAGCVVADQPWSQLNPRRRCPSRAPWAWSVIPDLFANGASPFDGSPQPLTPESIMIVLRWMSIAPGPCISVLLVLITACPNVCEERERECGGEESGRAGSPGNTNTTPERG